MTSLFFVLSKEKCCADCGRQTGSYIDGCDACEDTLCAACGYHIARAKFCRVCRAAAVLASAKYAQRKPSLAPRTYELIHWENVRVKK